MRKTLFLSISAVIAVFFIIFLLNGFNRDFVEENYNTAIKIGNYEVVVEIVDDEEERSRGLGWRKDLPEDSGMLFIFEIPAQYSFWMKDMRFPIDIIWISENSEIVAISENIIPETYPASFSPSEPVKYVLEVNAGWANKNNIKEGDFIEL